MKILLAVALGTVLLGQNVFGTPTHFTAPSAASILAVAESKAAAEHKNVLVIFHASWCTWCHKLDGFLAKPEIAPLMDANYVTVHIDIQENEDKRDLDNPGGEQLLDHLGGKNLGIPYYAIISPANETLALSKDAKGNNIGYPGEAEEIPVFMKMIRSTSHRLSDSDAALIGKKLREDGAQIQAQMELVKPIEDAMANHDYKKAISACDAAVARRPDLASYALSRRFEALLHVDEDRALFEFGQPLGERTAKQADSLRAGLIAQQDSLSDRAYSKALPIILASGDQGPYGWHQDILIALAYSRVHQMKKAMEYQDKAIQGAQEAKLPQAFIDSLVKAKQDWQDKD